MCAIHLDMFLLVQLRPLPFSLVSLSRLATLSSSPLISNGNSLFYRLSSQLTPAIVNPLTLCDLLSICLRKRTRNRDHGGEEASLARRCSADCNSAPRTFIRVCFELAFLYFSRTFPVSLLPFIRLAGRSMDSITRTTTEFGQQTQRAPLTLRTEWKGELHCVRTLLCVSTVSLSSSILCL